MKRGWLFGPLLMLAAGCTTLPADEATKRPIEVRQVELLQLENWQATGSIALKAPDTGISGSLDWQQQDQDFTVTLTAALGQGVKISQQGNVATLTTRGKAQVTGASAETLVLRQLRVRVPLKQLSYWIRGLPGAQGEPAYDRYGRLSRLKYVDPDGISWRAKLERYGQTDNLDLPALIQVMGGDYEVRVIIREWNLFPEPADEPQIKPGPGRIKIPGLS